jgi:hypothetical protein
MRSPRVAAQSGRTTLSIVCDFLEAPHAGSVDAEITELGAAVQ